MNAVSRLAAPPDQPGWWAWLRRELAPYPGRGTRTLGVVVAVVLVTVVSMALQTPETAVSAYMVFFVSKENRVLTMVTGIGLILGATLGIAISLFLFHFTFDHPELRIPAMALTVFACMFLSRTFVIGPLAFAIGFVIAITQNMGESVPDGELLGRALLWAWMFIVYPAVLTVIVNQFFLADPAGPHAGHAGTRKPAGLFVPDAFTNPNHVRFALKVTLAAMSCYLLYTGLDWPGIHTAFITCIFIALESTAATIHKAWLRLGGCMVGGSIGFLSIMYLLPHMESISSLVLLTAGGTALAAWVAAGSPRIAYAGLQIALAFYMCIFQGFAPETNFTTIRDRLVGIVLGVVMSSTIFLHFWPEREPAAVANHQTKQTPIGKSKP